MFETLNQEALVTVTGGVKKSGGGDVCRDAYAATGGFLGGLLSSESGGWGAIPGAIGGGALGRKLCPK